MTPIALPLQLARALACAGAALALLAPAHAQIAAGKPKYLGNVIAGSVPQSFNTYWNQVTPENSGKWEATEPNRNQMNWSQLDMAYNHARASGFMFKQHTFVWGNQAPRWMSSLPAAQQAYEVEEFMRLYCQRYPQTQYIDVVNEPISAPAGYRNAIGGSGSTGWDWVVWSFQKARQHCPNAKLLINEYGIIDNPTRLNTYLQIINVLRARGLVDGIGIQSHFFSMDNVSTTTMRNHLNALAQTGLPIHVSELDMTGSDSVQQQRYQQKFPIFWEHPAVAGVTLWGYIEGTTWEAGTHLVRRDGSERPALTWLKSYVRGSGSGGGGGGTSKTIVVRARGTSGQESVTLRVNGSAVRTWTLSTTMTSYTMTTTLSGGSVLEFTNDATGRDVQVDYLSVNGSVRQAEAQTYNTGVWQSNACGGGSGRSEWLHCNGAIGFGNL